MGIEAGEHIWLIVVSMEGFTVDYRYTIKAAACWEVRYYVPTVWRDCSCDGNQSGGFYCGL